MPTWSYVVGGVCVVLLIVALILKKTQKQG
jgi:hypothetical protein